MKKLRQSESLLLSNSRWLAYAAASSATALAGCQTAEGAIHYSGPIKQIISGSHDAHATFQLDRRGDSIAFEHLETILFSPNFAGFKAIGLGGASFRVNTPSFDFHYVGRLGRGVLVSDGSFSPAWLWWKFMISSQASRSWRTFPPEARLKRWITS